ncbi:receptor-like protein 13 [Jatropha curcas]|uniref:receptor-like protein 13 n=1 Tax=Jatropha curcas TaxID=180498 RepID=UPI0018959E97|nr:receptor-like protein 13 [Jatropha curcas]
MMRNLKTLSLLNCRLTGSIPADRGLCELKYLQQLDFGGNNFNGSLPWCLANLTSLKLFDLSYNNFIGDVALSPLRSLTSLKYLNLFGNLFQIPISLSPFFNHSKLNYLDCQENKIYVTMDDHNLTPKFQLDILKLSGYHLYGSGKLPKFLYHQYNLRVVDLSHNRIQGKFPKWLLENNTKLEELHLANNSLSGSFQLPTHSLLNLSILDVSDNCLYGYLPKKMGIYFPKIYFPKLRDLNMRRNSLSGNIPSSFGNMSLLTKLDLSDNNLSGSIPEQLTMVCISLNELILSDNSLQGQIFPESANLEYLEKLLLDGNRLSTSIPNSLSNCTRLIIFNVSDNHLFGNIPKWIGNMSSLEILDLSLNSISGSLSSNCPNSYLREIHLSKNKLQGSFRNVFSDCSSLMVLDLSPNKLIGKIPTWIVNISRLSYILLSHNNFIGELPIQLCGLELSLVDFSHNNLSGHILPCLILSSDWSRELETQSPDPPPMQPLEFTNKNATYSYQRKTLLYLSGIDFSCNRFSGEIPPEIGNLSEIQVLNLSHNILTGPIPQTFSNSRQIESLNLSYNNLEGKIPSQLTQLYSLAVFSVAHNNLSGKTPERVAQFATFEQGSYEGNSFLCGLPLPKPCDTTTSPPLMPTTSTDEKEENGFIDMGVFYVSFVVSYIIVFLGIVAILYINPYWRRVWFYYIELTTTNCYYFFVDNISFLSKFGVS